MNENRKTKDLEFGKKSTTVKDVGVSNTNSETKELNIGAKKNTNMKIADANAAVPVKGPVIQPKVAKDVTKGSVANQEVKSGSNQPIDSAIYHSKTKNTTTSKKK
jgi:hypothetical protein